MTNLQYEVKKALAAMHEAQKQRDKALEKLYKKIQELYEVQTRLEEGNEKITEDATATTPAKDAPALVKKIGWTTYIVRVHFSKASKETMSDKIKRMLKNEMRQI